jgi:Winged helix-turn helix
LSAKADVQPIFQKTNSPTFEYKRNIEMTPLCKIEVTHPRVLREVRRGVLSMSKQEFSRLDVLLQVQSGRLRVSDACVLIGVQRRQVFRLLRGLKQDGAASLLSKRRGRPSNHPPAGHHRAVVRVGFLRIGRSTPMPAKMVARQSSSGGSRPLPIGSRPSE